MAILFFGHFWFLAATGANSFSCEKLNDTKCQTRFYTHKTQGYSSLCRWCGNEDVTPSHFLCNYPYLMTYRQKLLGVDIFDSENYHVVGVNNLLAYCSVLDIAYTHELLMGG